MKKHLYLLLLLTVFVIAFFLRFYKLGEIPNGLYQDETAIGWNAYSIMTSGKDEFGVSYPLYFKSFGDWKLPVYIYSAIIPIKLFGLTSFAVRFPSAFFGFLTVIIFYFFVLDFTRNKNLTLLSTALLAINPWSLHYNRATFEVSISLFFFILGAFLLNKYFRNNFSGGFLAGAVCFIIALYTYNLTRLLAPLLFLLSLFFNKKYFKKINKSEIYITVIIGFILLLPFIFTLKGSGGASSASGTVIYSSSAVQAPLLEFRSYAVVLPRGITALLFNKYSMTLWQFFINIFSYFSVSFFFINGSSHGNHGIGDFGLFYLFELPLIIIGLTAMMKTNKKDILFILYWFLIVISVSSLTRDVPHATRSFFLILPLEILSGTGLYILLKWIFAQKKVIFKSMFLAFIGMFIIYNLIFYFTSYYLRFPILYAKQWNLPDRLLAGYLKTNQSKYNKIIIDQDAGVKYSSLLFYLSYSPDKFRQTVKRASDDSEGFSEVLSFGNYEFRKINWSKDRFLNRALIILKPENKPADINSILKITYPKRPVVISVKEIIQQYPVEEKAYELVETK